MISNRRVGRTNFDKSIRVESDENVFEQSPPARRLVSGSESYYGEHEEHGAALQLGKSGHLNI